MGIAAAETPLGEDGAVPLRPTLDVGLGAAAPDELDFGATDRRVLVTIFVLVAVEVDVEVEVLVGLA